MSLTMSIDEWAKKVAHDIAQDADERAPADAAILAHPYEFEERARRTRLKMPAFARAWLTTSPPGCSCSNTRTDPASLLVVGRRALVPGRYSHTAQLLLAI